MKHLILIILCFVALSLCAIADIGLPESSASYNKPLLTKVATPPDTLLIPPVVLPPATPDNTNIKLFILIGIMFIAIVIVAVLYIRRLRRGKL